VEGAGGFRDGVDKGRKRKQQKFWDMAILG